MRRFCVRRIFCAYILIEHYGEQCRDVARRKNTVRGIGISGFSG